MEKGKKLTNKEIIEILLPIMQEAEKKEVKFDQTDFYGQPCHIEMKNGCWIKWTNRETEKPMIEVWMNLKGKYDHATLVKISGSKGYGYKKEFKGMGNGYYADISEDGRIVKGEWD